MASWNTREAIYICSLCGCQMSWCWAKAYKGKKICLDCREVLRATIQTTNKE